MYFIDSARGDILAWDYSSEDATLSNERSVFSLVLQNLPFNLTGQKSFLRDTLTRGNICKYITGYSYFLDGMTIDVRGDIYAPFPGLGEVG